MNGSGAYHSEMGKHRQQLESGRRAMGRHRFLRILGYYKPSLQAYLKAVRLLGLKPEEAMMVAAHEGDLAAARAAGMYPAHVSVPEKDNMSEGFEQPDNTDFDVQAEDFETLCQKLKV